MWARVWAYHPTYIKRPSHTCHLSHPLSVGSGGAQAHGPARLRVRSPDCVHHPHRRGAAPRVAHDAADVEATVAAEGRAERPSVEGGGGGGEGARKVSCLCSHSHVHILHVHIVYSNHIKTVYCKIQGGHKHLRAHKSSHKH